MLLEGPGLDSEGGYPDVRGDHRRRSTVGAARAPGACGSPAASRTIRPDLTSLVRMLKAIPEIEDVALSTNGVQDSPSSPRHSGSPVSIASTSARDSLRRFSNVNAEIARRNLPFDPVASAQAASNAGLDPEIKLNAAAMRRHQRRRDRRFREALTLLLHPWHVRFHRADAGRRNGEPRRWQHVVPSSEVLDRARVHGVLEPSSGPAQRGTGPAEYHRYPGALWNDRRHHADDSHLLRFLHTRAPHRRRPPAHLSLWRSRSEPPRICCVPPGAGAAVHRRAREKTA